MEKKRIIVSDSSANLLTGDLDNFVSVPMKIVAGDREFVDDEKLCKEEMLEYLKNYKGHSGSACPGVGEWLEAFGDADEVFAIAITSHLSGSYNAACVAKASYQEQHPDRKVFVLDSLSAGPEPELIIEKYRTLINSGLSFDEIQEEITKYSKCTLLLFSLESLSNFAKNGRVKPAVAAITSILGIRLVGRASVDGELEPLHKCRGEKKAIRQIFDSMKESGFTGGKVRISHTMNKAAADTLADMIRAEFPECDIKIRANKGLCCFYAEPGGFLVGFEGKGL
ncbi:MAG: DegV family protein [Eubacteriales bacterium]|nr:DegV family protein [Eubacteriales bacterium]